MPPNAVEPGTRLVDRYRLEEHLGEADGTSYWRAHDELLDRPVGHLPAAGGASQADRVLRAARRAAAVTDARFLRVLDASEVDGVVYVVSEWVTRRPTWSTCWPTDRCAPAEARELAHRGRRRPGGRPPARGWRTCACSRSTCCAPPTASSRSPAWPSTPPSAASSADEADAARRDTQGAAAIALRRADRALARCRGHRAGRRAPRRRPRCAARARCGPASRTTWTRWSAGRSDVPGSARRTPRRTRRRWPARWPPPTSPAGSRSSRPAGTGTADALPPAGRAVRAVRRRRPAADAAARPCSPGRGRASSWSSGSALAGGQL